MTALSNTSRLPPGKEADIETDGDVWVRSVTWQDASVIVQVVASGAGGGSLGLLRPDVPLATLTNVPIGQFLGVPLTSFYVPQRGAPFTTPPMAPLPIKADGGVNAAWYVPDWKYLRVAIRCVPKVLSTGNDQLARLTVTWLSDFDARLNQPSVAESITWRWRATTSFPTFFHDFPIKAPWFTLAGSMPGYPGPSTAMDLTLSVHNGAQVNQDSSLAPDGYLWGPLVNVAIAGGAENFYYLPFYEGWAWLTVSALTGGWGGFIDVRTMTGTGSVEALIFRLTQNSIATGDFNGPIWLPARWTEVHIGNLGGAPATFYGSMRPITKGYEL